MNCFLCKDSGELLIVPKRVMGYTLARADETIDEYFVECPCTSYSEGELLKMGQELFRDARSSTEEEARIVSSLIRSKSKIVSS